MKPFRKPNLFVIGAMKSGTSTLHNLLAAHPEIFMSSIKEPSRFVAIDDLRRLAPEIVNAGYWREETYAGLFADAGEFQVVGESSTNYSKIPYAPGVALRIHAFNPSARFVYIMRDPVERAISHYWHQVGYMSETRTLMAAITEDPRFIDVSNYDRQLTPYVEAFGLDRIYTLTLESLRAAPAETLAALYRWLGVAEDFRPPSTGKADNETPAVVEQAKGFGWLDMFRKSRAWARVSGHIPSSVRAIGRSLAVRPLDRSELQLQEAREYLIRVIEPDVARLTGLLSREFPQWTTAWKSVLSD